MRKTQFIPSEFYHIFNRGVDQRKVFLGDADFIRALVYLVIFNDQKYPPSKPSRFVQDPTRLIKEYTPDTRDRLVDINAFTLLSKQYHFLFREKVEGGISKLMHRFDKGYSRYFNLRNERSGSLWHGSFGAKHVDNQAYAVHIVSYIHLNILDLYQPDWREGKIKDWSKVASKLVSYPWSSYAFYRTEESKIPFIELILTEPEWFKEYYPSPEAFEESLRSWSRRAL